MATARPLRAALAGAATAAAACAGRAAIRITSPARSMATAIPCRSAALPRPRRPLVPPEQPWNIPGVQRGFVPSPARSVQVQLFKVGDQVQQSSKFGKGVIREVTGSGDAARLRIVFPVFGEKVLAQSIAPIVKIEE